MFQMLHKVFDLLLSLQIVLFLFENAHFDVIEKKVLI